MGTPTHSGDMGADGGSISSVEESKKKKEGTLQCDGHGTEGEGKENDSQAYNRTPSGVEQDYEEALSDVLNPPTPPNLVSQIIKEGFVQTP